MCLLCEFQVNSQTHFLTGKYSGLNLTSDIKSLQPPPRCANVHLHIQQIERKRSFSFCWSEEKLFIWRSIIEVKWNICAVLEKMCMCWQQIEIVQYVPESHMFITFLSTKIMNFIEVRFSFRMCGLWSLVKTVRAGWFPASLTGGSFKYKNLCVEQQDFSLYLGDFLP